MASVRIDMPLYLQLVQAIETGFQLLDEESQAAIRRFVAGQQQSTGVFSDRAGHPDWYYSLFGFWLSSALKMKESLILLAKCVDGNTIHEQANVVDKFALILIQEGLADGKERKPGLFRLFRRKESQVNFMYRMFLLVLVFDARYGKNRWVNVIARFVLKLYQIPDGSPCSVQAALTVARQETGLKTEIQQQQLLEYLDKNTGGFRAFTHVESADMLSTGVALFALKKTGFDMRLIAPGCLEFVQSNFVDGAFLSGDGDPTCDLEYTFYGLLALGCLAGNSI